MRRPNASCALKEVTASLLLHQAITTQCWLWPNTGLLAEPGAPPLPCHLTFATGQGARKQAGQFSRVVHSAKLAPAKQPNRSQSSSSIMQHLVGGVGVGGGGFGSAGGGGKGEEAGAEGEGRLHVAQQLSQQAGTPATRRAAAATVVVQGWLACGWQEEEGSLSR